MVNSFWFNEPNINSIYLRLYIFLAPHIYHKDLYIAWVYPRDTRCLAQGPGFDLAQLLPRFITDSLDLSVIKPSWYFQFFHLAHPANQFSFFINIYFIFDLYLCLFNCFGGERFQHFCQYGQCPGHIRQSNPGAEQNLGNLLFLTDFCGSGRCQVTINIHRINR